MRLNPPITNTLWSALGAWALGILLWVAPVEVASPNVAFWLTAVSGIMLLLSTAFTRV